MTVHLDTEDLLHFINDLGVGPIRDLGLLDSAAHRPSSWVLGTEAYPGLHLKAAVLLESLLTNHPLVDGNERLGWLALAVFYSINGIALNAPDDEAYELVIAIADGSTGASAAADHLSRWTGPLD